MCKSVFVCTRCSNLIMSDLWVCCQPLTIMARVQCALHKRNYEGSAIASLLSRWFKEHKASPMSDVTREHQSSKVPTVQEYNHFHEHLMLVGQKAVASFDKNFERAKGLVTTHKRSVVIFKNLHKYAVRVRKILIVQMWQVRVHETNCVCGWTCILESLLAFRLCFALVCFF